MEVLLVPIKINICPDLCLFVYLTARELATGPHLLPSPKGAPNKWMTAVFIMKFSKGKLFWSNWSNNMREVISGQFPAVFALENIFQVFSVLLCGAGLPSLEFSHASASRPAYETQYFPPVWALSRCSLVNFIVNWTVNKHTHFHVARLPWSNAVRFYESLIHSGSIDFSFLYSNSLPYHKEEL